MRNLWVFVFVRPHIRSILQMLTQQPFKWFKHKEKQRNFTRALYWSDFKNEKKKLNILLCLYIVIKLKPKRLKTNRAVKKNTYLRFMMHIGSTISLEYLFIFCRSKQVIIKTNIMHYHFRYIIVTEALNLWSI